VLTSKLDALNVNLTSLALRENLVFGKDEERDSTIVDENRMQRKIREMIRNCKKNSIVIDGHYAASVVPKELATHVFVLRRDPVELRRFMEKRGFSGRKLWENLASEILDVCLIDALNVYEERKVCELDVTSKSVEETIDRLLAVLNGSDRCRVGVVDWLGKLESEGLLEELLRI